LCHVFTTGFCRLARNPSNLDGRVKVGVGIRVRVSVTVRVKVAVRVRVCHDLFRTRTPMFDRLQK